MGVYLVTIGLIFALMIAGIGVDRMYRNFAARNPKLGPFRKSDGACGCCSGHCSSENENKGSCHS